MSIENLKVNGESYSAAPLDLVAHASSYSSLFPPSLLLLLLPLSRLELNLLTRGARFLIFPLMMKLTMGPWHTDPFADDVGDTQPKNYVHIRIQR